MKLKESFITHKNKDDYMMIDASGEFAGLIHSNATTAFIVDCLRTETTREEIVRKILAKYDADEADVARDVDKIINALKSIGAVDE
ncbi:MAG: PqqD family protein [Oscillospiraceae bacterium]|nr:PqqD family protein [Ruminococcus sp.]MDD6098385.1 PqqD family protein [Oscillospiraceae bacterium]